MAAVGRAELITTEHIRAGAQVIDVGTNPTDHGGLVGDVNSADVEGHVAALAPAPGGGGPVTTALLLEHTIRAAERGTEPT